MEAKLLWTPTADFKNQSNLQHYCNWLSKEKGLQFSTYDEIWKWSIDNLEVFWSGLFEYFNVQYSGSKARILEGSNMPFYRWFPETNLNYAEHIFRNESTLRPAIIYKTENSPLQELSWQELRKQVTALRHYLKNSADICRGDCVVGYLTNTPESVISFLAVNSLGAVWSSCSPDFGVSSVIDRFSQIAPKAFIAVNGYSYGGKYFDKTDTVKAVSKALPTAKSVIVIDNTRTETEPGFTRWEEAVKETDADLPFEHVNFNDPIWVLYSSGTTGKPKAITHSHGGILLEHYKYLTFHSDVKEGDRCFWYTTTGWMMWNYIQSSLLCGGTLVMYEGSPAWPDIEALWQFAAEAKINHFGTSAGYIVANLKEDKKPKEKYHLTNLISVGSTGSPLPPEGFDWIYNSIKKEVWLTSISGGTDICSAFVGGNPLDPVISGEIQCRALGCDLKAFNETGQPVMEQVAEMVITQPMPSMPIYFWNDRDNDKYKSSYFEMYPGIWRHGDWIEITKNRGIKIYGRSDATLNRGGVRIGTSEIYSAVDKVEAVADSLIICVEREGGDFYMPLFVKLKAEKILSDELIREINSTIRCEYSPRHVPDVLIATPDIPYTISGKKTEAPVKKLFMGRPADQVVNKGSLRNPEAMDFFIKQAQSFFKRK